MPTILAINSGSSSIKASLFAADGSRLDFRHEHLRDPRAGFEQLFRDLYGHAPEIVGHRFVHGGDIDDAALWSMRQNGARLQHIVHLSPLIAGRLMGLDLCDISLCRVACFDTAFHTTLPELAKRLPIPQELGLHRFGFHGLNYAWIASQLPALLGDAARGRIVVAHLGSGASLCQLENLKSVDTTMGYTPAGGITMGTRSGDLDPGVMLELAKRFNAAALSDMVFHQMGLLALSDESSEMSKLYAATAPRQIRRQLFLPPGAPASAALPPKTRYRCARLQQRHRRARLQCARRLRAARLSGFRAGR
jgi:acetate kinase